MARMLTTSLEPQPEAEPSPSTLNIDRVRPSPTALPLELVGRIARHCHDREHNRTVATLQLLCKNTFETVTPILFKRLVLTADASNILLKPLLYLPRDELARVCHDTVHGRDEWFRTVHPSTLPTAQRLLWCLQFVRELDVINAIDFGPAAASASGPLHSDMSTGQLDLEVFPSLSKIRFAPESIQSLIYEAYATTDLTMYVRRHKRRPTPPQKESYFDFLRLLGPSLPHIDVCLDYPTPRIAPIAMESYLPWKVKPHCQWKRPFQGARSVTIHNLDAITTPMTLLAGSGPVRLSFVDTKRRPRVTPHTMMTSALTSHLHQPDLHSMRTSFIAESIMLTLDALPSADSITTPSTCQVVRPIVDRLIHQDRYKDNLKDDVCKRLEPAQFALARRLIDSIDFVHEDKCAALPACIACARPL